MNDTSSSEKKFVVELGTFDEILPIWKDYLWVNRHSPIKPMSSMTYNNQYDLTVYDKYRPTFFMVKDGEEIIGVNSGHKTGTNHYRSRGLYVKEQYRRNGIATLLLDATVEQAKKEHCSLIWTYPRLSSLSVYNRAGFKRISNWEKEDMEFGPNCLCIKDI